MHKLHSIDFKTTSHGPRVEWARRDEKGNIWSITMYPTDKAIKMLCRAIQGQPCPWYYVVPQIDGWTFETESG